MTLQNPSVPSTEADALLSYKTTIHSTPIFFVGYPTEESNQPGLKKEPLKNYSLQPIDAQSLQFALQFLAKQQTKNVEISDEITFTSEKYLLIKKKEMLVKVTIDDILYIESEDKYCYVYAGNEHFLVQKSLKNFVKILPSNFMMLHRKYIVNTHHIASIHPTDYTLTLKNNAKLPISQRYRKVLLALFTIIK
jgi:DNA-binding LytR/AlgR family response regulator